MSLVLNGYKLYFDTLCSETPCIHSDTIYSMIVGALLNLDLLEPEDIPSISFSISSAFLFYDNFLFFPIPADFSKAKIPDLTLFNSDPWLMSSDLLRVYFHGDEALPNLFHSGTIIAEESHPVHLVYPLCEKMRTSAQSMKAMRFKEKSGLYFLYHISSPRDKDLLDAAMRYLCDEGIGARRSVGLGSFSVEHFSQDFSDITPTKQLLLSLCSPEKKFFDKKTQNSSHIRWIKRTKTPHFSSPRDSKYCYMMREGSVFSQDQSVPSGSIVRFFNANKRLSLDTPIYRFGKPFFLE